MVAVPKVAADLLVHTRPAWAPEALRIRERQPEVPLLVEVDDWEVGNLAVERSCNLRRSNAHSHDGSSNCFGGIADLLVLHAELVEGSQSVQDHVAAGHQVAVVFEAEYASSEGRHAVELVQETRVAATGLTFHAQLRNQRRRMLLAKPPMLS